MDSKKKGTAKAAKQKPKAPNESKAASSDGDEELASNGDLPEYGNGIDAMVEEDDDHDDTFGESGWSSDDDRELVSKLKTFVKPNDKVQYKTRLQQLNWNDIAFKSYSASDCQKRFEEHLKRVRRHRNLNEIVTDVEENIKKCPVKKPLNSYQIFIQDQLSNVKSSGDFAETMKNLATMYKTLTPEQRAVYTEKANDLKKEYFQKKQEFSINNPNSAKKVKAPKPPKPVIKTPYILFTEHNQLLGKKEDASTLRETFANLSLDEKYKWVLKAVSLAPEANIATVLNKEEQRIFKGQVKAAPTAYSLYVKDMYPKLKNKYETGKVFSEIAQRWKALDGKTKKKYTDQANALKDKAFEEQEMFNRRHGVSTPKKSKKRKSISNETVEQDSIDEFEETDAPQIQKTKSNDKVLKASETLVSPLKKSKKSKESLSSVTSEATIQSDWVAATPFETPQKKQKNRNESVSSSAIDSNADEPSSKRIKKERVTPSSSGNELSPVKANKQKNAPMTTIHTPLREMERKRTKSVTSESNTDAIASDVAENSVSGSAKKKSKKEKKSKKVPPPGDKPPTTLFKYFEQHVHTGKPHKAKKHFDKLPKKELKRMNATYNELVEDYVSRLKNYLSSLPKDEAREYIAKVKEVEDAERRAAEEESDEYNGESTSQE